MANSEAVFEARNVYGNVRLYPVNEVAESLCALCALKTFENRLRTHFNNLSGLGFSVKIVGAPSEVAQFAQFIS